MAICKCKMCGGDLNITELDKVVECEYCGTTQTVPSADNEKKMTLFNRANRLRSNNEFDKAAALYEQLAAEFPEEAEAYWGLCLCNYGIEYVDDPVTGKKIPTCHRASFEKLSADENFSLAMEYADVIAQRQYRAEAREIDRINEEILSVSRNETPYDIFICYKDTDENGGRTPDSVMAQDIYDTLTAKGYKVFFSRISLEDKLGQQYEPYIFAALNSAKIMLSVGTKYEYFHAVWVKNEWSRFLRLAAKDKSKVLIPCYKDMDPYDMPDEFQALQGQDLGKLGAIQDLVRGVDKLLGKNAPVQNAAPVQQVVVANPAAATTESLLKRAFMFLEDGEWQSADEYAEKVLDIDPENGEAYLAKAMVEMQVELRSGIAKKLADNSMIITLVSFELTKKVKLIMAIRSITGMVLSEAKEFVERKLPAETNVKCTLAQLKEQLDFVAADNIAVIRINAKHIEFSALLNKALRFGTPSLGVELEAIKQEAQSLLEQRIDTFRAEEEQRRIAEEERKKAEEEHRKAEEEKKRKEEKERKTREKEYLYQTYYKIFSGEVAQTRYNYEEARRQLLSLGNYKNAKELVEECSRKIEELRIEDEKSEEKIRIAAQKQAEEKRIAAEKRAMEERQAKISVLIKEKADLEAELPTLKGIFKSGRRKEAEARLAEIEAELKKLQS